MVLHSSQPRPHGGDRADTVPECPAAGRKAPSPVYQGEGGPEAGHLGAWLEGRSALESALGESRAKLVAVPRSCSRASFSATCPAEWLLPAQNSPCVLPASAGVLWPSWRSLSPQVRGGLDGHCSHGLTRAWTHAPCAGMAEWSYWSLPAGKSWELCQTCRSTGEGN